MANSPPRVYLLTGDDDFARNAFLQRIYARYTDAQAAQMNTARFSARELDLRALSEACLALPFLAERRAIILEDVERLHQDKTSQAALLDLFDLLPPSTALFLIEHPLEAKRSRSHSEPEWIQSWIREHPQLGYYKRFKTPHGEAFAQWLLEKAEALGGRMKREASALLAESVADDPFLGDLELRKLLEYVDYSRPIEAADVEALTPFRGQSSIFSLVDAIGQRRMKDAQRLLNGLLRDIDPGYAFAMIIRQFRLLIQAREALALGTDPAQAIPGPGFVRKKVASQARNFNLHDLEAIYGALLDMDLAAKTSLIDIETGLDMLLGSLASNRQPIFRDHAP